MNQIPFLQRSLLSATILASLAMFAAAAAEASHGLPCPLGGTYNGVTNECEVTANFTTLGVEIADHTVRIKAGVVINARTAGLVLTISPVLLTDTGDLILETNATIDANDPTGTLLAAASAKPVTINVLQGKLEMATGSAILAENHNAAGSGGAITIAVGTEINLHGTARISSKKFTKATVDSGTGGAIVLNAGPLDFASCVVPLLGGPLVGDIRLDPGASVVSDAQSSVAGSIAIATGHNVTINGTVSAHGLGAQGKGGLIVIDACCDLTIGDTGLVSSKGGSLGADRVHLEGCCVKIFGKVESTSSGAGTLINGCNEAGLFHPANPAGCVEVFAGTDIVIDRTGTHKGGISTNTTATAAGTLTRSWIDLLARRHVTITAVGSAPFAVHANSAQHGGRGGQIQIVTPGGNMTAVGLALQADATSSLAIGGDLFVEASGDVTLDDANIFARGDFSLTGGVGTGGKVGTAARPIRAFNGTLSWTNGVGDVRPTGDAIVAAQRGAIELQTCLNGPPDTSGSSFPANGTATTPNKQADACDPTGPSFGLIVNLLVPAADCVGACDSPAVVRGVKFDDVDGSGTLDPGEGGLSGWTIHLFGTTASGGVPVHEHATTSILGTYSFSVPAGTYTVCETLKAGWIQTAPDPDQAAGACTTHTGASGKGYALVLLAGDESVGINFGNLESAADCPEDRKATLTRTIDPSGTSHGALPNHLTVQDAYDAAANGEVIGFFGNTVENVTLDGNKTLKITQCTTAGVTAADSSLPVWTITSTGALTIVGPDSSGGTVGWSINTDHHDIKSVRASGATHYGILILGTSNGVSFNDVSGNGVGIRIEGFSNDLRGGTVATNIGDGVQVAGTGNVFRTASVQSNGGYGIVVEGTGNTIRDNARVDRNALDGILVLGDSNTVLNNAAGSDKLLGNGGSGFNVVGSNNTLDSNTANANAGSGFAISGVGTGLKSNQSNQTSSGGTKENTGAEYLLVVPAVNLGGNKADTIGIPKTTSPVKCPTFPAAGVCE